MATRDLRKERAFQRMAENRKSILLAAEKVFAENGYTHTAVDDIAREAQFSKATLYRYYRSKKEIFSAVILESFREAQRGFLRILQKERDAETKLREIIHFTLSYYKKKESFARIFLMERGAMQKALNLDIHEHMMPSIDKDALPLEFKQVIASFHRGMASILQEGMEAGEFRRMDPAEAGYILGALLRGFHFRGFIQERSYTVEESTDILHSFFLHGLRPSVRANTKGECA
jgi:AcrR family transcriptional regulator